MHDDDGEVIETGNLVVAPKAVNKWDVLDFSSQVWGNVECDNIIDSGGNLEKYSVSLQKRIRSSLFVRWINCF